MYGIILHKTVYRFETITFPKINAIDFMKVHYQLIYLRLKTWELQISTKMELQFFQRKFFQLNDKIFVTGTEICSSNQLNKFHLQK